MLHVVAHVERDIVPGAVIRVGLVASVKHVVLGYKVSRHWVDSHAEKSANDKIKQRLEPEEVQDENVKDNLYDNIEQFKFQEWLWADDKRT